MPDADADMSELQTKDDDDEEHIEPPEEENGDGSDGDGEAEADTTVNVKEEGLEPDAEANKESSPPRTITIKKRRPGRPPKNRSPEYELITIDIRDLEQPKKRGRGGWRGRGGRKGAMAAKPEQIIDAEGTVADIVDDECVLPEDPEGETKVDKLGNLNDGRDYRCRTFTVLGRGNRQYMLSTEPARCVGFRDSYLFFTKHRKLYKIIVDDEEKRDMIDRDIIPHSYKGRSIGIVTARSVFREFGARIIVGGKRVIDDYAVTQVKAEGAVEGELADPADIIVPGEPYNKNQYVAWHGASAVYHTNVPSVPDPTGKPEYKKRKVNVNDTNWMLEHAREASTFNANINSVRKLNNNGVYDIHTNVIQYPAVMQPTQARIVQVAPGDDKVATATFPAVPLKIARNFMVADVIYQSPSGVGPSAASAASDAADMRAAFHSLEAVPDDVRALLPPDCRKAFDAAINKDKEWKAQWGTESNASARRQPIIDKAIVPYSKG